MNEFIHSLQKTSSIPSPYSWFHLLWFLLIIAISFALCYKFKDASVKTFKIILLVTWLIIVVFEIYKEVVYSFYYDAEVHWTYNWGIFPFQLCSTPFYVLPLLIFLPADKMPKIYAALLSYMIFYSFFGGVVVYFNPKSVLVEYVGINIQTMVHHGSQVVLGIYMAVWCRKHLSFNFFLKSVPVFLILVVIACLLNWIVPHYTDYYFNMFFISPRYSCILGDSFYPGFPYPIYLTVYIVGVTLSAFIIWGLEYLILRLIKVPQEAKE